MIEERRNKSTAYLGIGVSYEWFRKFEGTKHGRRKAVMPNLLKYYPA